MLFYSCDKMSNKALTYWHFIAFSAFSCAMIFITGCTFEKDGREEQIQRYKSGNIARRYYLVNGKKEGIMTDYYPDGRMRAERMFSNNLQDGRTILYYPEGQTQEVQYFVKGLREKSDSIWYQDGQLQFVSTFLHGKKHGYLRKWSPEGTLIFEAKYQQDSVVEINGATVKVPSVLDIPH